MKDKEGMTVKDLIERLKECNPEADVSVITHSKAYSFSLCWGGGGEGESIKNCAEVHFYVDELNSAERESA